ERKAVSKLEVANRDHVTLEARHSRRSQRGIYRATGNRACVDLRRIICALEPVQVARTGLSACAERICRCVRDRQSGIKPGLVRHERIQQNRTTYIDCEYVPGRAWIRYESWDR